MGFRSCLLFLFALLLPELQRERKANSAECLIFVRPACYHCVCPPLPAWQLLNWRARATALGFSASSRGKLILALSSDGERGGRSFVRSAL